MVDFSGGQPLTDASYIQASLRDPNAFAVLFERHAADVAKFISRSTARSDVGDLVADTFLAAFRSRHRYALAYPNARPWLFGIAAHVVSHHRRSQARGLQALRRLSGRRRNDLAEDIDAMTASLDAAKEHELVQQAMARLSDDHREVLLLYAGFDLGYEDVARALGIPVGTVRSRLSRARGQLRELLAEGGQYLPDKQRLPAGGHRSGSRTPTT